MRQWTIGEIRQLQLMYAAGRPVAAIATALETSETNVHHLVARHTTPRTFRCAFCRQQLGRGPRGRRPVYCSRDCNTAHDSAYRAHRHWLRRAAARCRQCGGPVPTTGRLQKFCTKACANRYQTRRVSENA